MSRQSPKQMTMRELIRQKTAALEPAPGDASSTSQQAEEIFRIREQLAEQNSRNAQLELAQLKKLLEDHETARLHALKSAASAHRQLKTIEEDQGRIRGDLRRAREQLTRIHQEKTIIAGQAAARELALRNELQEARMRASAGSRATGGSARIWLAIAFCLIVPALIWAAVTYWHSPAAGGAPVKSAVTPNLHRNAAIASTGGAPADLTGALSRLDDAFTNFPGVAPERVLQLVHKDGLARGESVCSFEWNGGNVSLLFGSGAGNDPGSAINRCADAVEKAAIR